MICASVFLWLLTIGFAYATTRATNDGEYDWAGYMIFGAIAGAICSVTMTVITMIQHLP